MVHRILALGFTIPSSMAMDPDDLATILSLGLYPLVSPGKIGAGLCPADSVPLVGTPWRVGSELGESSTQLCSLQPFVKLEDIQTKGFIRIPARPLPMKTPLILFNGLSCKALMIQSRCAVFHRLQDT